MYKFEISADSPEELKEKQMDFAREQLGIKGPVETYKNEPIQQTLPLPTPEVPAASPLQTPPPFGVPAFNSPSAPVSIPSQPLAAPAVNMNEADRDSRGFPYDSRIHSSTKAMNKDGSYRYKRGVGEADIQKVEFELLKRIRSGEGAPEAAAAPVTFTPPPVPAAPAPSFVPPVPPGPVVEDALGIPMNQPPVQVPPTPAPAPIAAAPVYQDIAIPTTQIPAHSLATFKENLVDILADLINQKKIDQAWINGVRDHFKLGNIWKITENEPALRELYNKFGEYNFITKID